MPDQNLSLQTHTSSYNNLKTEISACGHAIIVVFRQARVYFSALFGSCWHITAEAHLKPSGSSDAEPGMSYHSSRDVRAVKECGALTWGKQRRQGTGAYNTQSPRTSPAIIITIIPVSVG